MHKTPPISMNPPCIIIKRAAILYFSSVITPLFFPITRYISYIITHVPAKSKKNRLHFRLRKHSLFLQRVYE